MPASLATNLKEHQMNRLSRITTSFAGRAGIAAGSAFGAGGVVEIVHSQRHTGSHVVGVSGHLALGFFVVGLLCIGPFLIGLARYAGEGSKARPAALVAAAATTLLGLTCIVSLIQGHDAGFFGVVAPMTNLAWFGGSVVLAVALWRAGRVPRLVAAGLPLAWVTAIMGATVGGGVLTGAYLIATGYMMLVDDAQPETAAPGLASAHA